MARLKEIYRKEIAPKLKKNLSCQRDGSSARYQITLNMGLGEASATKKSSSTLLLTWRRSPVKSRRDFRS
jgi:ribosomal protein L5